MHSHPYMPWHNIYLKIRQILCTMNKSMITFLILGFIAAVFYLLALVANSSATGVALSFALVFFIIAGCLRLIDCLIRKR